MENKLINYTCEKCNYKCKYESELKKHCNTELHKTGIRKKRSDYKKVEKCVKCEFEIQNQTMMKQHYLNEHCNKKEREEGFTYYCKECDFGTFSEKTMEKHKNTKKHKTYILRSVI